MVIQKRARKIFVVVWLIGIAFAIGLLFWYNDLQYQLPTPVPEGYQPIKQGTPIHFNNGLSAKHNKPLFLHFFNPICPCSRFNIKQFKALVAAYGNKVDFAIVVMSNRTYSAKDIQNEFDLALPVYFDNSIATACGVYSTPQVALLNANNKLYYRGNYNRSRYCTDEQTSYAKFAINGLLANNRKITFNKLALISYGCKLPGCKN